MIIVKLTGGLGNQLFQYALGRRLALEHKTNLFLDTSFFKIYNLRNYELLHFNIAESKPSLSDVLKIKTIKFFITSEVVIKNLGYIIKRVIKRKRGWLPVSQKFIKIKNNIYVEGSWPSEKYFKNIENVIRQDLTLKEPLDQKYLDILNRINDSNSVSLHVRRGDYLNAKNLKVFAPDYSPEYYREAIKIISDKVGPIKLFIFSDEINWVKNNIPLPFPTEFVSPDTGLDSADYQELILMSACRHNITANSTFSWWGAWLNNNHQKIVITPKKWFLPAAAIDERDMIPSMWIKI